MRARLALARARADRAPQRARACSASPRPSGCRLACESRTHALALSRSDHLDTHNSTLTCPFSSSAPSRSIPSKRRSARPTTCSAARRPSSPRRRAISRRCSSSASSAATIRWRSSSRCAKRGVDLAGLEQRRGRVVPLARPLPPRPQLGRDARDAPRRVLALQPEDSRAVPQRAVRLPRQHRPAAAARRAEAGRRSRSSSPATR